VYYRASIRRFTFQSVLLSPRLYLLIAAIKGVNDRLESVHDDGYQLGQIFLDKEDTLF
jgi:hypothetical protein